MQESGLPIPKIHALEELLTRLLPRDPALATLRLASKSLTRYAVEYRYPGPRATKRNATAALNHVGKVRAAARARLHLDPSP